MSSGAQAFADAPVPSQPAVTMQLHPAQTRASSAAQALTAKASPAKAAPTAAASIESQLFSFLTAGRGQWYQRPETLGVGIVWTFKRSSGIRGAFDGGRMVNWGGSVSPIRHNAPMFWTVRGTTILVTYNGTVERMQITKLTQNAMVLKSSEGFQYVWQRLG